MRKVTFYLVLLLPVYCFSQPGGGGDPGDGQPVPFWGLYFLVASGIMFGVNKLRKKNK